MQNGEKGVSKYRIEAARNLAREGIVTEPVTDDILHVTLGGKRLCWVTDSGSIGYYREHVAEEAAQVVLDRVRDVAQTTREYMTQLEQAPPLSASGLASEAGYGLLSEFNGIVLAGKITRYGAQFVTWEWVRERTGLYQGNYYGPGGGVDDYASAKRDFAVRSGLLPACALFKQEQLVLILNRKQKKELRRRLSTRQLMGIDQLTEHGLKTAKGELVFFLLSPDNLSVLSSDGVRNRVRALTDLLRGLDAAELLALDSRESFQSNKDYYQTRLEREEVPAIREMLRRNMAHLDDIQSTTASAREFALVHRVDPKSNEDYSALKQLEKRIQDCGFHVRMADEQDVKRLLAVYYQQDVTTEHFDSFDGEGSVCANG